MAYDPRPSPAGGAGRAGAAGPSHLDVVARVVSASLGPGPGSSPVRGGDAGAGILGDDRGTFVLSDIAARRRHLPQRSASQGQHDHLAALLAPLSGRAARDHSEALLARFGSINAVGSASHRELTEVFGEQSPVPDQIAAVRRLLHAGLRERVARAPLDTADAALLEFVVSQFSGLRHELVIALFGDEAGGYLDHCKLASGSISSIALDRPVLFHRAASLGARQIVLAHNHPSGIARPSAEDMATTRRIARDGAIVGIALIDHLIVAGNAVYSMKREGLL